MTTVLLFAALAVATWLVPARWRPTSWLLISFGALYALQSPWPDFATLTLILVIGIWWLVGQQPISRRDWIAVGFGISIAFVAAILRGSIASLTVGLALTALSGTTLGALIPSAESDRVYRGRLAALWILALIAFLVILKTPALVSLSRSALGVPGLAWFGFSYIAFRLIHVLIDYRNGRLPPLSLHDFALYVVFFPTLTAGPIDRVQHFLPDALASRSFEARYLWDGGRRVAWGLFRKFIVADSLYYLALRPALLDGRTGLHPLDLWLMVYVYAFYIFFDFAGYTDCAIGIGMLVGLALPENFKRPYTRRNIALFWNNWHITLSSWYQTYVFTPLSRNLLRSGWRANVAAFTAQVSTMILIGLWHGVSVNFALWGLWHGLGLYVHRRVLARMTWPAALEDRFWFKRAQAIGGVLLTFHFVALGWVFFALPDPASSLHVLLGLVGVAYGR